MCPTVAAVKVRTMPSTLLCSLYIINHTNVTAEKISINKIFAIWSSDLNRGDLVISNGSFNKTKIVLSGVIIVAVAT